MCFLFSGLSLEKLSIVKSLDIMLILGKLQSFTSSIY